MKGLTPKEAKALQPNIYNLKLGDEDTLGPYRVTRVPGGWIFWAASCVFVPFSNEFRTLPTRPDDDENF